MKTAQQIIQEAIEYRNQPEPKGIYERLFDFRTEKNAKSSIILYLTERLQKEMQDKEIAERRAENTYKIGKKCVEIYGLEAELLFNKHWQLLT